MKKQCLNCGTDLHPLTGSAEEKISRIEQLRKWDLDVPAPICVSCFAKFLIIAESLYGKDFFFEDNPPPEFLKKIQDAISRIEIFTYNPYENTPVTNLGLLSSHVFLGRGTISNLTYSVLEFFSQEPDSFALKLEEVEKECLKNLQNKARKRGATAVVGLKVIYTELTSGNDVLMTSMIGTAVRPAP
ncbi:MAG: heavy metal-binding domain-containing protein [Deltaproteobacteria bacterium]|jgi:uncharacterized protein YbjQ (UPF0145 family)|nr:heavy metal-binding domain-containing protein [Deltaproteobacteria bacterium]